MTEEEKRQQEQDKKIADALDKKFKETQDELKKLQDEGATKNELKEAISAIEKQGQALEDFIEEMKEKRIVTIQEKFTSFLKENQSEIKNIYHKGSGEIVFNPYEDVDKAPEDITTGNGNQIDAVPNVAVARLGDFDLRNDNGLISLMNVSRTGKPFATYTEMIPKDGDYDFVAEGAEKPQIDFKWETRHPRPKKIAAYEILTEEAVTDYTRLSSIARTYLRQKHDLFKVNGLYFGSGAGEIPSGVTTLARTFVVGAMADKFENGKSNFMDKINAVITDIYTTQAFADEMPKKANVVMISPLDFFLEFQSAKDGDGLPLYPQASLFNSVSIGGVTIRPWIKIPNGKVFVGDMKKYNLVNYIPFSIRIGWINDQFITNKFTMLGESRFFQYVKNLDLSAFVYDDLATIEAAIEAA